MRRQLALALVLIAPLAAAAQPARPLPAPDVPEWAKRAVWYQIFPDRFRNGDPANDPTLASIRGSWPHLAPEGWRPAAWTADWYAQSDWERATGQPFYTTVQLRRYGGDFAGLLEKLDYLDSLGVTALYLNPVFRAPSLHKYDGSVFHHVDDHFGPDPAGDLARSAAEDPLRPETWVWTEADRLFLRVIDEAHRRGMKVVLDGVFNHMGLRSFPYESLVREGPASPYRDWFNVRRWDDATTPDSELDVQGWMGVRELPELREDSAGLIPPVRDYVFASVRRWMDPNGDGDPADGIDGWRLDVAEMVDLRFWQAFRQHARTLNPDAYLVGEVWWEDWPRYKMFMAAPWLQGDAFDAVMNYRWARAARRFFLGSDLELRELYGPARFARELDSLRADYPAETNYVLMNLYGSHDTDRLASQVVNPGTRFDHRIGLNDNRAYRIRRPTADEWALMRLMLVHQFTYVGAPHLFYGDEAGMWGADDPDERKPMVWPDLTFAPEAADPFGRARTPDPVKYDTALANFYRRLAHLRTATPALTHGSFRVLVADDMRNVFAYERRLGEQVVVVAFDLSGGASELLLPFDTALPAAGHTAPRTLEGRTAREALTGRTATVTRGGLRTSFGRMRAQVWVVD